MSVVANVAINVDARGAAAQLRQFKNQSQATQRAAEGLSSATKQVGVAAQQSGRQIQTSTDAIKRQGVVAEQTSRAFNGLGLAIRNTVAAFSLIQAGRFIFAKTSELETQTRSLQVLTGSAEKAGQIIKELQQLGAVTPFTSTELIETAKRLQAFGVEADRVVEITRRLADVSGATGAELQGLATAYGQVQAKGRLQGEELLQFQERGVALQEVLRKEYGLTSEEFQKALGKGQISAQAVEYALIKLTETGGKYANGAIAQSDTLSGRLSTLQDGVDELARKVGALLSPALLAVINQANQAISQMPALVDDISLAFQYAYSQLRPFINGLKQMQWYFTNLTPPGWAMQIIGGAAQRGRGVIGGFANRQRQSGQSSATGQMGPELPRRFRAGAAATLPPLTSGTTLAGRTTGGGGAMEKKRATLTGLALAQGFSPENARIMAAIALAESGGRATAHNRKYPDNSYGLWQINMLGGMGPERRRQLGLQSNEQLFDPATNARAAKMVFNSQGFNAWSVFRSGAYKQFLGKDAEVSDIGATEIAQAQIDAAERMRDQLKMADEQNVRLKDQLALVQETNHWKRVELEYDIKKSEIAREYDELKKNAASADELTLINANQQVEAKIAQIQYEREINELIEQRARLMVELTRSAAMPAVYNELEQQDAALQSVLDKYPAIGAAADAAASMVTTGVGEMIAGTKSAEQVFVDFLQSVADALLNTAKQMIAQYIAIGLARMFAGLGGGGGGMDFKPVNSLPSAGLTNALPTSFAGFAEGGFVTGPTRAMIGEGGEPEYVIPASKMQAAMSRYSRGARGNAVIPASSGSEGGMGAAPAGPVTIDVRYSVERINNVEYVTADQFREGMRQAAQQGAAQGEQRTLRRLQQSPSTRRRVGV